MDNNCGECRYFHTNSPKDARKIPSGPLVGECQRYPPTIIVVRGGVQQQSPIMEAEETCGEWKEV